MKTTTDDVSKIQIIRQRSLAGSITSGWQFVANNIWNLLRPSWPLLVAAAIWGIAWALIAGSTTPSPIAAIALIAVELVLCLAWLLHTALLLRAFNASGYIPSAPLHTLWQQDHGASCKALLRAAWLLLRSPRQWLALLALLFVNAIVKILSLLLFGLPLVVTTNVYAMARHAVAIGDTPHLPTFLTWFAPLVSAVSMPVLFVLSWLTLVPLAFFVGSAMAAKQSPAE